MRFAGAVIALALLAVAGTGAVAQAPRRLSEDQQARWDKAQAILAKPDLVELYSLDPNLGVGEPDDKPKEQFRGWPVLGKSEVKGADARKTGLAVAGAIKPGNGPRCFEPRHGIRATAGGKTVDLVICFHCGWAYVYLDQEDSTVELTIDLDQQPALDKVLTDAKVPLPPRAKE
jgi:hypothetical protein